MAFSIARNHAPVFTAAHSSLGTTAEDAAEADVPVTFVSQLIAGRVTDSDGNAAGIAIVGVDKTVRFQYSLDGGATWINSANASETNARLLSPDARFRLLPNANFNGTARIFYRAWDQTIGSPGGIANVGSDGRPAVGGGWSLSSVFDIATLTVTGVNDAPVPYYSNYAPSLPSMDEDTVTQGSLVSNLTGFYQTDVDAQAKQGIAVVEADRTSGDWQFSRDNGASWQSMPAVSDHAALLLPDDANTRVRFIPAKDFYGYVSLKYRYWDQTDGTAYTTDDLSGEVGGDSAYSSATLSSTLHVYNVNDAPVLDTAPSPTLDTIVVGATNQPGTLVSRLVANAQTDVDSPNAYKGIAIVGVTGVTQGTWQYSTDNGAHWKALGSVSAASARLLKADASTRIRFLPQAGFSGQVQITYRAWDQTQGWYEYYYNHQTIDLRNSIGGTNAFSTQVETATLTVGDA
jgi:hypothetical protein